MWYTWLDPVPNSLARDKDGYLLSAPSCSEGAHRKESILPLYLESTNRSQPHIY